MDKIEYVTDNSKAVNVKLSIDDLQEIEKGLSNITFQGARLNEDLLGLSEE
jgi:hypothetical protein